MSGLRVLCAFAGGAGHADPLVPVATALREAGHEVAFHGRRSGAATAIANGFPLHPDPHEAPGNPGAVGPLRPIDREHERHVLRAGFAERIARDRCAQLLALAEAWSPELIVGDEADFGAMLAAERLGVPHAVVVVNASGSFGPAEVVAPALRRVRRDLGLDPDGVTAMLAGGLTLNPFPPSFRDPRFPLPETSVAYHGGPVVAPDTVATTALERLRGEGPTIYVTLGTIFPAESGDLFPRLLAAIRALHVRAVVTVGRELDPAGFGPQPEPVLLQRYLPQDLVLPRCDLVVNHAGSGSLLGALAHGLPLVALPLGADQPWNADRVEVLGLGAVLDAATATPQEIATAIDGALGDAAMRGRAAAIRDELEALPGPEATVPALEALP